MLNQTADIAKERIIKRTTLMVMGLAVILFTAEPAIARKVNSSVSIEAVVSPDLKESNITKIAVESFTVNGSDGKNSSLADIVNTRLFGTGKYRHANRNQGDAIGKLLAEELKYGDKAVEILGIDALVRGTVTSYEMMTLKGNPVPSIGFSIKLVSLRNLEELWTLSSSGVGQPGQNVGIFASQLASESINELINEWTNIGDTLAVNLPKGNIVSITPGRKKATLEIGLRKFDRFKSFAIFRSDKRNGQYQFIKSLKNKKTTRPLKFFDKGLMSGTTYFYKVVAIANSGLSAPASDIVSVKVQ